MYLSRELTAARCVRDPMFAHDVPLTSVTRNNNKIPHYDKRDTIFGEKYTLERHTQIVFRIHGLHCAKKKR